MAKTLLVCLDAIDGVVTILVPKRRGEGFLRQPFGHHVGQLTVIENEIGFDIWGLDGSLDVQTGSIYGKDIDALVTKIITPLCSHYGMAYRVVDSDEYWTKHPLANKK